jgi:transcriptional regulator with XRE-family HTH domain
MTASTPMMDFIRAQLRRVRSVAGLTQEEFGKRVNYSGSHVSAVETGTRPLEGRYLARCDEVLDTGGLLVRLLEVARRDGEPSWFRPWREAERDATALRWFEPNLVPGLLQTEAYARTIIQASKQLSPLEIDQRVAARRDRQEVLSTERPPQFIAVLDEAVLRRLVGDAGVMAEQLEHLVTMAELPHIEIHVVPAEVGLYVGLAGSFVLASFEGGASVAYLDNQLRGQIITDTDDVDTLQEAWERIRSEALPRRQSINLIKEVAQTWI